jgi:hypothetical protein
MESERCGSAARSPVECESRWRARASREGCLLGIEDF